MNQNQDNTPGRGGTRNRDAEMQEVVTSAVGIAIRPLTTRLGELRQQLDPIIAHLNDNTVHEYATILQSHLNPMNRSIETLQERVERVEQRFDPLNERLNAVQDQVLHGVDQRFNNLDDALQATHNDIQTVSGAQVATRTLTTDVLINSYQTYNSGCMSGLTRPFKVIPFVRQGGATEIPSASGLPPLHDVPAINNLTDEELDQYLEGYGIEYDGWNRDEKLRKLRVYIGCTPEDTKQVSHTSSLFVMLVLGVAYFVLFPNHLLSI
ncbi:hypothetical protein V8B97DRAFT_1482701 [Scleroderma yunnanense]